MSTIFPPKICRQNAFSSILDTHISESLLDIVKEEFIFMIREFTRKDTINNLVKSQHIFFVYEKN